ncbi:hypothetical protein AAHE18_13G186100 [Arachis hypogaea]
MHQPGMFAPPPPPPGAWSTGLCDCCKEPGICCFTLCCPCFTFGWNAEIIDRGRPCILFYVIGQLGCVCLYSHIYRNKLRGMYGLKETPCKDCCVHCWCGYCALCQEYRELKHRGWKPRNGWEGQDPVMMTTYVVPPQVAPGMSR